MTDIKHDWTNQEIHDALGEKGTTAAQLSRDSGYLAANTVSQAISVPYPKVEKIIADFIGVKPEEIWPSRYDRIIRPRRGIGGIPSHSKR